MLMSLGVNTAFIPVELFSVAFTGLGVLAHYTLHISVGLVVLLLNIPLFLLAWKYIGKSFVMKNLIVTGFFSLSLDLLSPLRSFFHPPLWEGILIGGILFGVGSGLVFRQGLTSGGVGLLAWLIQLRYPNIKIGSVHIAFDFCVLFLGAFLMDLMTAFYTFIASIIMGKAMDLTKTISLPFKRHSVRKKDNQIHVS
ncbi:hypothetical protein A8F95_20360 [Bacillus wudalianchiensis]|uniref:YitT family protein n=2 Tax=Pseudobacillus wudalianchiensis TaxID=1743143 RepID=A0A1B9B6T2_9BACI|nr:hypothetical protein A8F95_20360 [Bacillus wudalianchiensis]